MLTTKKTKYSIGAKYVEPHHVEIVGKRIKANHIAIAEINSSLRVSAEKAKIQAIHAKIWAKNHYSD